jgi:predicted ATPase
MVAVSPFVGRTEELGVLLAAVARRAGDGRPVAAVVVGDSGSGKSRLLAEVFARVGVEPILRVGGYEPERRVPFAGASELLRTLAQGRGADARRLRSLLYERSAPDSGLEPLRVLEAVHRCLREIGPTVVAVDDLHWVDDQTLAALPFGFSSGLELIEPGDVTAQDDDDDTKDEEDEEDDN